MPASARVEAPAVRLARGLTVLVTFGASGSAIEGRVWQVNERHLSLSVPDLTEDFGELTGREVTLTARVHGRLYAFDTTVAHAEYSPPALIVQVPREARRAERRNFYRLACNIPARAEWLDEDQEAHALTDARLIDISGGGALLRAREAVPPGTRLRLAFTLEGSGQEVEVQGRALRSQAEPRNRAFRINTQFERIERRTQEHIIRFIFRQQSLLSRRRSL